MCFPIKELWKKIFQMKLQGKGLEGKTYEKGLKTKLSQLKLR